MTRLQQKKITKLHEIIIKQQRRIRKLETTIDQALNELTRQTEGKARRGNNDS